MMTGGFFASFIGSGVVVGLLIFFAKESFKKILDKELAKINSVLRMNEKKEELALQSAIEFKGKQLSEFYWPIYLRLQKDNVVWRRILERNHRNEERRKLAKEIEMGVLMPNHLEIVEIIETKMHLSQADSHLEKELFAYLRHVSVYAAMREVGIKDDPYTLDEPWPEDLFPAIEGRVKSLQADYDHLVKISNAHKSFPASS